MKLKCMSNYTDGWLGYNYKKELTINKIYVGEAYVLSGATPMVLVYSDSRKWERFPLKLFIPAEDTK